MKVWEAEVQHSLVLINFRMAASRSGEVLEAASGLALRRLSLSSFSAHWNNWNNMHHVLFTRH